MGQKDKLIERLKSKPKDFTYNEAASLLGYLGYTEDTKGKTSGSRVKFVNEECDDIRLHKPHPGSELKNYQIDQLIDALEKEGLI